MTIEEKAKAYDEALEYARIYYDNGDKEMKTMMKTCFPELVESKDEKMRKAIYIYLDWLDGRKDCAPKGEFSIEDMIAWLKKQEEERLILKDKIESLEAALVAKEETFKIEKQRLAALSKFRIGDIITNGKVTGKIDEINERGYHAYFGDCYSDVSHRGIENWQLVEQKPVEWSEEDEKMVCSIIGDIKCLIEIQATGSVSAKKKIDWLKSLSSQSHWKPSDRMMEALEWYMHDVSPESWQYTAIEKLYKDLKKLKG